MTNRQAVIRRMYLEGKSRKEIAEELGTSTGAIGSSVKFLRKKGHLAPAGPRGQNGSQKVRPKRSASANGDLIGRIRTEITEQIRVLEAARKALA